MNPGKVKRSTTLGSSKKKKRDTYDISKQGITATKIELAAAEIAKENKRRKKFNASRVVKKDDKLALPIIYPRYARIHTRRARDEHGGTSGIQASNKYLCGRLSALCLALRAAGLSYPWRTQEAW